VLGRLILLFILVPLADLVLLMVLSQYIGWQISVALVILSGIIGAYLARRSSMAVFQKLRTKMSQGQMSPDLLSDGAMILFAAGLLLTPGFITDVVGLSLLFPACRGVYKRWLTGWFKKHFKFQVLTPANMPQSPRDDGRTVDGEVVRHHNPHREPPDKIETVADQNGINEG
jgi:UPF0716 protein FxsA